MTFPAITEQEMPRWSDWLESATGIALEGRQGWLERGLYPRLKACGVSTLEEYQALVDSSPVGEIEKLALIDELTVKDSSFFRDSAAMKAVGEFLRRERIERDEAEFRLWSLGCALGQETWSLAMVAAEQFAYCGTDWQVMGTDISPSAIMHAKRGEYSERQMEAVSDHRRTHFFEPVQNGWLVGDSLRKQVRFGTSNIRDIESCPYMGLDVIFCQNVLIYFRSERARAILNALVSRLRPGGLLVLGAGEAAGWTSNRVSRWRPETINAYRVS